MGPGVDSRECGEVGVPKTERIEEEGTEQVESILEETEDPRIPPIQSPTRPCSSGSHPCWMGPRYDEDLKEERVRTETSSFEGPYGSGGRERSRSKGGRRRGTEGVRVRP